MTESPPQLTPAQEQHGPGVRIPPPVIFAVWVGVGLLLRLVYPTPMLTQVAGWWVGGAVLGVGFTALFSAMRQFPRHGTGVYPDRPDTALILRGLYRYSRNPIYTSLLVLHIGTGLAWNSAIVLVMVVPLFLTLQLYVIPREERYLACRFGATYEDFRRRVRRWV